MSASRELVERVRAATAGGPYLVQERPYGFDLTIDIVDARWFTLIHRNGVRRVFTHRVRLDEGSRRLAITDVSHTVRWAAGGSPSTPPRLRARWSFARGRVHQFSAERSYGLDDQGRLGRAVDYTFSAAEGRDLIRRAAREAGWRERMGGDQRGALIVGLGTLALLAGFGLYALVTALLP